MTGAKNIFVMSLFVASGYHSCVILLNSLMTLSAGGVPADADTELSELSCTDLDELQRDCQTGLRVYGESAHLHLKFTQNFALKLAAEFCNLLPTPKYLWKWMPTSMRFKFVTKFN